MAIDSNDAGRLDQMNPTAQRTGLGTELKSQEDSDTAQLLVDAASPRIVSVTIVADATGGLAIPIVYSMVITDVIVEATATNGAGTVTVKSGANAITDAIVAAVDTTIVRAGTLDATYTSVTSASTITAVANGAGDRAKVTLIGIPV